jgi:hypothetical protein
MTVGIGYCLLFFADNGLTIEFFPNDNPTVAVQTLS